MSAITTGAPKMAVTALMESSTGENSVRAIKSQPAQKMAPPKKHAGITRMGFDDFSADRDAYERHRTSERGHAGGEHAR